MTNVALITKIADRAGEMSRRYGVSYKRMTIVMDLANADGQHPLDLAALLAADDGNFAHDIFGIRRHMNRETGLLEDCFVPRYARQQ